MIKKKNNAKIKESSKILLLILFLYHHLLNGWSTRQKNQTMQLSSWILLRILFNWLQNTQTMSICLHPLHIRKACTIEFSYTHWRSFKQRRACPYRLASIKQPRWVDYLTNRQNGIARIIKNQSRRLTPSNLRFLWLILD